MASTLRVAYATNELELIARMYSRGLELAMLGSFENHSGYDGVILGRKDWSYHLEFTSNRIRRAVLERDDDDLLVFYLPDAREWETTCDRMLAAGFVQVPPANPYWALRGKAFEDIEGRVVVLQHSRWPE